MPLNILRRGRSFYFFDAEKSVDAFLNTFERSFVSGEKVKFQGYIKLIDYQTIEIIELESKRVWLTDMFTGRYFNKFIRGEIRAGFLERVIINGTTGSSWQFNHFERIFTIITDVNQVTSLLAS